MKGWSRGHSEMPMAKLKLLLPKFKENTSRGKGGGGGVPCTNLFLMPKRDFVAWLASGDPADSITTDTTLALSSSLEESPLVQTGERAL